MTNRDENTEEMETSIAHKQDARSYIPSVNPGCRLPHMLISAVKASSSKVCDVFLQFYFLTFVFLSTFLVTLQETFSTLDLIPGDKLEFVLIIAPVKESYSVARTFIVVAQEFKVSLKVCIIWPKGSSDKNGSETELEPWKNFIDVHEASSSSSKSWWELCRMSSNGVILVRPDEHIAWRVDAKSVRNGFSELKRVFSLILRLNDAVE